MDPSLTILADAAPHPNPLPAKSGERGPNPLTL